MNDRRYVGYIISLYWSTMAPKYDDSNRYIDSTWRIIIIQIKEHVEKGVTKRDKNVEWKV